MCVSQDEVRTRDEACTGFVSLMEEDVLLRSALMWLNGGRSMDGMGEFCDGFWVFE